MKTLHTAMLFAGLLLSAAGFSQEKKAEWKEMKAYHTVMAATFHPSEEGNFAPVKEKSGELAKKATAWTKSVYPEGYDKAAIAPVLKKLAEESKALDSRIKAGAANEEIKKMITALHERFHEVAEKCDGAEH